MLSKIHVVGDSAQMRHIASIAASSAAAVILLRAAWKKATLYAQEIARLRAQARDQELDLDLWKEELLKLNSEVAAYIAPLTATEIVHAIREGKVTSEQVILCYIRTALYNHRRCNSITHSMFREALTRAKELDEILRTTGKTVGPLHGLPVSIKEHIPVAGTDATLGFVKRCNIISTEDSLVVKLLREQGAIPFVKTNVPQTLLFPETSNPIFGITRNPWNLQRSPGGSSGGEGALIAGGGSPVGVGSDIGGSIRIPAHFSGICGLKPTFGRISGLGVYGSVLGQEAIRPSIGPMGISVEDLALLMRAWCSSSAFSVDVTLPPLPFDESLYHSVRKPRIGYFTHDGFFRASHACVRAVEFTVQKLREQGYEVVPFQLPRGQDAVFLYYSLISADGAESNIRNLEGEPREPTVQSLIQLTSAPAWVRSLVRSLVTFMGWPRVARIVSALGPKDASAMWKLQHERTLYKREVLDKLKEQNIEILICPGLGVPAFPHSHSRNLTAALSYTFLFNLLDLPAGTVPVTTVNPDDLLHEREVKQDMWERFAHKVDEGSEGLPVGVQVAGLPFQDEFVLRIMREVEQAANFTDSKALRAKQQQLALASFSS